MSVWIKLKAFFGFILSKFSKLFGKRMNQKISYAEDSVDVRKKTDPESPVVAAEEEDNGRPWNASGESINLDSHFLAEEREGRLRGRPVSSACPAREGGAAGDSTRESALFNRNKRSPQKSLAKIEPLTVRDSTRPVHKAIELFDKPNDIETSLPRYQNKVSRVEKRGDDGVDGKKSPAEKVDKLKSHFQEKCLSRVQKCRSEKDFHGSRKKISGRILVKSGSEDDKKAVSPDFTVIDELKMMFGDENRGLVVSESKADESKSEKEKHNSLLKVNLSQMTKRESMPEENELLKEMKESWKEGYKESDFSLRTKKEILEEEKALKPLSEVNYVKSLSRREEKSNSEYGGGWECHRCGERVYHAERMLACGNAYHKTCFSCVNCRKLLGPRTYLEAEMEIYCGQCHGKKFGINGYGYGVVPGVLQTSP